MNLFVRSLNKKSKTLIISFLCFQLILKIQFDLEKKSKAEYNVEDWGSVRIRFPVLIKKNAA
jgi:hypothetical protein